MIEPKRTVITSLNDINLLSKDHDRDSLKTFITTYLEDHTYINSKNLSHAFLFQKYNINYHNNHSYLEMVHYFTHRFGFCLSDLIRSGIIERYNTKQYRKTELMSYI